MDTHSSVGNEERKRKREPSIWESDIENLQQEQFKKEINETDINNLHRELVSEAKTFLSDSEVISPTELHQVLAAKLAHFDRLLNAYLKQVHEQRVEREHLYQSSAQIADRFPGPTTNGVPSRLNYVREYLRSSLRGVEAEITNKHAAFIRFPNFVNETEIARHFTPSSYLSVE